MGFTLKYRDVYFLLPLKIIINSRSKKFCFQRWSITKVLNYLPFFSKFQSSFLQNFARETARYTVVDCFEAQTNLVSNHLLIFPAREFSSSNTGVFQASYSFDKGWKVPIHS